MHTPSRSLLPIFLLVLTLPGLSEAVQPRFTATYEAELIYEDNILRYSDKDIDDFVNNRRTSRYAIQTYDDMITHLSAAVVFRCRSLAGRTRVRLKYSQRLYAINSIKDYQTVSLHLRQYWGRNQVQLGYVYIPRFYVRHLPDIDGVSGGSIYQPFDFERHQFSLKTGRSFTSTTSAELWFRYRFYDYNSHFDEYDMQTFSVEPVLSQKIGPARLTG